MSPVTSMALVSGSSKETISRKKTFQKFTRSFSTMTSTSSWLSLVPQAESSSEESLHYSKTHSHSSIHSWVLPGKPAKRDTGRIRGLQISFFSLRLRLYLSCFFVFVLQPLAASHFPLAVFAYLCMFRLHSFFHVGISLAHSTLCPFRRSGLPSMTTDMCWNEAPRQPHGDDKNDADSVCFPFLMHGCYLDIAAISWRCHLTGCCCGVIGKFVVLDFLVLFLPQYLVFSTSNLLLNASRGIEKCKEEGCRFDFSLLPPKDLYLNSLQVQMQECLLVWASSEWDASEARQSIHQ